MDFQKVKTLLLSKPGAWEDFPFGPDALVFKVANKMFALIGIEHDPLQMNLKCDPEHGEGLRAIYPSVLPGYHMNKRHWNTIILDGSVPEEVIAEMIDDSYSLVFQTLTKKEQENILSQPIGNK